MAISLQTATKTTFGVWAWDDFGEAFARRMPTRQHKAWHTFINQPQAWVDAAQRYRDVVYRDCHQIHILGVAKPVLLDNIYTDVYMIHKITTHQTSPTQLEKANGNQDADSPYVAHQYWGRKRFNALELIKDEFNRRLFILGEPGAGKSVLLRYIALQGAQGRLNKIPIFISLKDWSQQSVDLMTYLVAQFEVCNFPDPHLFVAYILKTGRAIMLFDGLDEVNRQGGVWDQVTDTLENFCETHYSTQCLITCHIDAHDQPLSGFQEIEMADFNSAQVHAFVTKWFRSQPNPIKRDAFFTAFYDPRNKAVRQLGNKPLLLALLCLAFNDTLTFPHRRDVLYEHALDALFRGWNPHLAHPEGKPYQTLSPACKKEMFAHIAAKTFEHGHYFLTQQTLVTEIEAFFQQLNPPQTVNGQAILSIIQNQHGLLVQRAQNTYAFAHLSFQEYFTAKYIATEQSTRKLTHLMTHITNKRWREVFLLTASLLDNASLFVARFYYATTNLIRPDDDLNQLITWANLKTAALNLPPAQKPVVRILYVGIVRALAYTLALDFDRDLNLDLTFNLAMEVDHKDDLDPDVARILDVDLDLDLALDLGLTLDLRLAHALVSNLEPDLADILDRDMISILDFEFVLKVARRVSPLFALDVALFYALQVAAIFTQVNDLITVKAYVEAFEDYLKEVITLSKTLNLPTLHTALGQLIPPSAMATKYNWRRFATNLRAVMQQERNLGVSTTLTWPQAEQLGHYFAANRLLLACLKVARGVDVPQAKAQVLQLES